jgi:pimeloyl-ACP methyl ester carboxylesterase
MAAAGVEPRYQTADGVRIRYVRRGQGPPVLLLHGIAASLYTWKDVLPALAADHDVIALDLPGFGGSDVPEPLDGAREVRAVLAFLEGLGLARVSVVGNSLGGAIAVALAGQEPARVDRLVLIDSAGYNFAQGDRPWMLRAVGSVPLGLTKALPVRPLVALALRQIFHDRRLVTPARIDEVAAPLERPGAAGATRGILLSSNSLGLPGLVRRVRAPTLVLWGRYDQWVSPNDAQRFAADIPGARVEMLEAGHMPQEERPQETAALIEAFLDAPR